MMKIPPFTDFWQDLLRRPVAALTDAELVAAVHAGVAACQPAPGADGGDSCIAPRLLQPLTDELLRRCDAGTSLLRQATALRTLIFAYNGTTVVGDRALEDRYWEMAETLIGEALAPEAAALPDAETRHAVGALVLLQWYGWLPEPEEAMPSALAAVCRWLAQWAEEQQADGSWPALPEREALWRMELWSMYQCLLLDDTYGVALDKALAYYYAPVAALHESVPVRWREDVLDLWLLHYQVLQQGPLSWPEGVGMLQRLSRALEGQLALGGHALAQTAELYGVLLEGRGREFVETGAETSSCCRGDVPPLRQLPG